MITRKKISIFMIVTVLALAALLFSRPGASFAAGIAEDGQGASNQQEGDETAALTDTATDLPVQTDTPTDLPVLTVTPTDSPTSRVLSPTNTGEDEEISATPTEVMTETVTSTQEEPTATESVTPNTTPTVFEWKLSQDFLTSPDQSNPNPDSYNNAAVWSFDASATSRWNYGSYSNLTDYDTAGFGIAGLDGWSLNGIDANGPFIAKNNSGSPIDPAATGFSAPVGCILMEPADGGASRIVWQNPISGYYLVTVDFIYDGELSTDGVDVILAMDDNTIASDTLTQGEDVNFTFEQLPIPIGSTMQFIVSDYADNSVDVVGVDITIALQESGVINVTPPISLPTNTYTNTVTASNTSTMTPSNTATNTFTPSITQTFTATATPTITMTSTLTFTPSMTFTRTPSKTKTATKTASNTFTPSRTFTPSKTRTATNTFTSTYTATKTPTITKTFTPSNTTTPTPTLFRTSTPTSTPTYTQIPTWNGE